MKQDETIKNKLTTEEKHDFTSLRELVTLLRSPGGCPWDIEQTHASIRSDLIEETYEVVEAIDLDDKKLMREELGDLLFQVVFHCDMEREAGTFTIDDVIDDVAEKMIARHPHVFKEVHSKTDTAEKVVDSWDVIKKAEKSRLTVQDEMNAVPKMLPALMRCQKVTGKAMKNGYSFDWDGADEDEKSDEALVEEIFRAAVLLKKRGVKAEELLTKKINDFIRFYPEEDSEKGEK